MTQRLFEINGIPAVLYGEPADRVFLFLHGQFGNKFEAEAFAVNAVPEGWQVLAVDLPEHGGRTDDARLVPWTVCAELQSVHAYMKENWKYLAVRANSIGCWFAMQAFDGAFFSKAMFVSPILDMEAVIRGMMEREHVSEEELREKGSIDTPSGNLSAAYLDYVLVHPLKPLHASTEVLYPGTDLFTPREVTERFCKLNKWGQAVMEEGEHWFHTPEQLQFLEGWEQAVLFMGICEGRESYRKV